MLIEFMPSSPGFLIASPPAVADLEAGRAYELGRAPLKARARDDQTLAVVGTGSPELEYRLTVRVDAKPTPAKGKCLRFGLRVVGGGLLIFDGYDLEHWPEDPEPLAKVPLHDAYYLVELRDIRHVVGPGTFDAELVLTPRTKRLPGPGWYDVK